MPTDEDMARIAIVTPDLIGPVANGGIGTSCTALAELLASRGYRVSVLLTIPPDPQRPVDAWRGRYDRQGIDVLFLPPETAPGGDVAAYAPDHPHLISSLRAYQWLAGQSFRIVFFMDWQGAGFYSLSAKATGLAFQDTWLIVQTHSPTIWHSIHSHEPFSQPEQLLTSFLERRSIEMADIVISPTQYMLDWISEFGWSLPPDHFVLPNVPPAAIAPGPAKLDQPVQVGCVAFFGRLEQRKGLDLFCRAIDRIEASGHPIPEIVFLGKFGRMGATHSGVYIITRTLSWRTPIRILSFLDQPRALRWLVENRALAVMPSVMDNAPNTIAECASLGVPFVARSVGGIPEMIAAEDHPHCLCGDNPSELEEKIISALSGLTPAPRLAHSPHSVNENWNTLISCLLTQTPPRPAIPAPSANTIVTVCITHKDRPHLLRQALDSVLAQTYPRIEVVLVDDGSTEPDALAFLDSIASMFRSCDWTILRQQNRYLGAARNLAARHARGDWILFLDDDNVCLPWQIETLLLAALTSGADILTSLMDVFEGAESPGPDTQVIERFLPIGGALAYGCFRNGFGDACALYRRSTFVSIGGFSEDYGIGCEDYEFFARAALTGSSLIAVPEVLFWYRRQPDSMLRATSERVNASRALRPYLLHNHQDFREVLYVAHGTIVAPTVDCRTQPLLIAVKRAEEALRDSTPTADALFWRAWALALLSDVIEELDSDAQPDALGAIANVALLLICTGNVRSCEETLMAIEDKEQRRRLSAFDAAFSLLQYTRGNAHLTPNVDSLVVRAFIAASWFMNLESFHMAKLKEIIDRKKQINLPLILERIFFSIRRNNKVDAWAHVVDFLVNNESEYTNANGDVAKAIKEGHFRSATEHYLKFGRHEKRRWVLAEAITALLPEQR